MDFVWWSSAVCLTLSLRYTYAGNTDKTVDEVFYFGEDGTLECRMFTTKVAWNFYSNVEDAEEKEISYGTRLVDNSGKYSITSEGQNLTVFNVSAHDAGKYLCDSVDVPEQNRRRFIVSVQQRSTDISRKGGTTDTKSLSVHYVIIIACIVIISLICVIIVFIIYRHRQQRRRTVTQMNNEPRYKQTDIGIQPTSSTDDHASQLIAPALPNKTVGSLCPGPARMV